MSESLRTGEDGRSWTGEPAVARRSRTDRALLILVLLLQVAIVGLLLNQRRPGVVGASRSASADSDGSGGGVSRVQGETGTQQASADSPAAVVASLSQSRAMFDRMDALFEQTVSEIAAMDRLFDPDAGWASLPVSPFLDMRDTGNRYVVVYGVPGMQPSDVQVVLNDRILTIHAILEYPPHARRFGHSFQTERSVRLPGPVGDPSEASAALTNGLLRVALPKGDMPARVLAVPVRLF